MSRQLDIGIVRLEHGPTEILGVFMVDHQLFSYCLELPWKNNEQSVSCIPEGHYVCERWLSDKYGRDVWYVMGVEGRDGIILAGHAGNTWEDTEGCILIGRYPGQLTRPGPRAVTSSSQITAAFEAVTFQKDLLHLTIVGVKI